MDKPSGNKEPRRRLAVFIVIFLIGIMLLILLMQYAGILDALSVVLKSLQALLVGLLISCLLNPVMKAFEKLYRKCFASAEKPRKTLIRALAVITAEVIMVAVVVLLLVLVIPQLAATLTDLMPALRSMIDNFNAWFKELSQTKFWQERLAPVVSTVTDNLSGWIVKNFGEGSSIFEAVTTGLMNTVSILLNIFIGIILSIYILLDKEHLYAQISKLSSAVFKPSRGRYIMEAVDKAADIFSGFFAGKIIEAGIVGVLCFLGMLVLRLPFATLISVSVGITNIIPFFGQYIGAAIGTALLLIVDPKSALIYLIFIIILMQIDGNLIGPKVLGNHTGLPPLWIVVAILFFGGCFGFVGTLIGVPVFAWIYYIVKRIAEHSLKKQGLSPETAAYLKSSLPEKEAPGEEGSDTTKPEGRE